MNTRFTPTIGSGKLHIGHFVNLLANWMAAKQTGGTMHLVADACQVDLTRMGIDQNIVRSNRDVISILMPRQDLVWYFQNNDTLVRRMLEHRLGVENVRRLPVYSEHFYLMALDFLLGVDTLVRGADWRDESANQISAFCLGLMHRRRVPIYYHPLVSFHGQKISKSNNQDHLSLEYFLRNLRISPISLAVYVTGLLERRPVTLEETLSYHERFDVANMAHEPLDFHERDLVETHLSLERSLTAERMETGYLHWISHPEHSKSGAAAGVTQAVGT